jgi:hypothetical protein
MTMTRIPIWLVENEVGGGLPAERTYSLSYIGPPLGYVMLPEGMTAERRADHVHLDPVDHLGSCLWSTRGLIEAAIAGKYGLSWEQVAATGASACRGVDSR